MPRKRNIVDDSTDEEGGEKNKDVLPKKRIRNVDQSQNKEYFQENTSQNVPVQNIIHQVEPSQRQISLRDLSNKISENLKSGKIRKIKLVNFMCHSNFEIQLNKCVNIIVGLNGSGKSAILTAIAIGLGSKANATARSTNLKDLVRRGETSATIEITLANDGIDSYDEHIFGKEITIVRNINGNTGASTYKLKNELGRVVSTTRQDLVKMCMCLNIQVENPVLVLNQDAARSFLKECDPKKLYQLFMKATQIEAIIEKLNSCFKTANASKNKLASLETSINHCENEIKEIKEKHTRLTSAKTLRTKITDYKNEAEWIQVMAVEKELSEFQKKLAKNHEEAKKIQEVFNNKGTFEKEFKEKVRDLATSFTVLQEQSTVAKSQFDKSRQDYQAEQNKLSEFESTRKTNIDRIQLRIEPNIIQLEKDIAEHENNPTNVEKLRQDDEKAIGEIENKRQEISLILQTAKRDFHMFHQTMNDVKESHDNVNEQLKRERDKLLRIEAQLNTYKKSGKDTLSVYGPSMSNLINEIESLYRRKRFTQLPRGPLGRYIEVSEPKYRQAVETILGNTLTSFVVNCDQDRILLGEILKKYRDINRTTIITTEFVPELYNISNGIVQLDTNDGEVLVNVITVSDPVVMNCLIDQKSIERIVLVEDTNSAIQLTQHEENVPQNLSRVVLLDPFSEYYPAPNYRSYALRDAPVRYIQTNFKDLVKGIERQKQQQEFRCNELMNKIKLVVNKLRENEKLVEDKRRLINELQKKDAQYKKSFDELKAVEYPDDNSIEFLRTNLAEEKERKRLMEAKIAKTDEKHNVLIEITANKKSIMDRFADEHRKAGMEMRSIQMKIETLQRSLYEMRGDLQGKKRELEVMKQDEDNLRNLINGNQQNIKQMTNKIKGKRVDTKRSDEELKILIRSAERRIANIENSNENIEEVELLMTNKMQHLDNMNSIRKALDNVLKRLTSLRESRYLYVRKLRQHMTLRVKHKFHQLMLLRNYTADVEIDHKECKLELKVIPRDSQIADAVSNTKSLSGGERSYSTVAFLIALWSCVDHPFYFLDEYDVFSDEYNRHIMTMLLLNEAEKKKDKQFGFLTPQDFSNIEASSSVTIHKLQDPDRMN